MNAKKLILLSLVLLSFVATFYSLCSRPKAKTTPLTWKDQMSKDSQLLMAELQTTVDLINKTYPNFYDTEKELTITAKEFGKKYLKSFAEEIAKNMRSITFEVKTTGKKRYFLFPEFIEHLKLNGTYVNYDNYNKEGSPLRKLEYSAFLSSVSAIYKDKKMEESTKKKLNQILRMIFKNDKKTLNFVEKHLTQDKINYEHITELLNNENKEIKTTANKIFEEPDQFDRMFSYEGKDVYILKTDTLSGNYLPSLASKEILQDIALKIPYLTEYKINLKPIAGINLQEIAFWLPDAFDKTVRDKLIKMVISEAISVKNKFLAFDIDIGKFNIHLLPSLLKKSFSGFNGTFYDADVNSAEFSGHFLHIFRKEEMVRTVLHELYHRLKVKAPELSDWLKKNFAIEEVNFAPTLNETIVESMTSITTVLMTAYITNPEHFIEIASHMWEREKLFATYQSAKILYLSGFENFEQFYNPKPNQKIKVKESTAIAEYHILKAAIIQNIDGFLSIFMNPKNKGNVTNKFKYLLLRNIRANTSFRKKVDTILKAFREKKISTDFKDFLFDTGRMTIIEPNIIEA